MDEILRRLRVIGASRLCLFFFIFLNFRKRRIFKQHQSEATACIWAIFRNHGEKSVAESEIQLRKQSSKHARIYSWRFIYKIFECGFNFFRKSEHVQRFPNMLGKGRRKSQCDSRAGLSFQSMAASVLLELPQVPFRKFNKLQSCNILAPVTATIHVTQPMRQERSATMQTRKRLSNAESSFTSTSSTPACSKNDHSNGKATFPNSQMQ